MAMVEVDGAFGALVRAHRQRLGLTQEELATKAGLSVRSIVKLEGGRIGVPRPPTVRLLAQVFGLTGADAEDFRRCAAGVAAEPPAGGRVGSGRVPAQLPPDVSAFTGREAQLAALDALAFAAADQPTAVFVAVVTGPAGVGKTALAVRWAHHVRDRFPGGQLYVNLRGYDPARPMAAGDALTRFLTALGVAAEDVPVDEDDRAARFRTEVADRPLLLLLDNASSAEQVRPLLPGTASCTVLVTSRDTLPGLVAVDGARRVEVDLLTAGDAEVLLRRLIGARARSAPDAVATLAEQCARLPLALRVAAELIAARPEVTLEDLVDELQDQRRRLAVLAAGEDPRASVPAVLSWSVRHLPQPVARAFGLLGLHPGPDFDAHAAASLTGAGLAETRDALALLVRAHLAHRTGPGRYGMHDLLRAYAGAHAEQPGEARRRMFDFYRATAASAVATLFPRAQMPAAASPVLPPGDRDAVSPVRLVGDRDAVSPVRLVGDRDAAHAWLEAERAALLAIVAEAATSGHPTHTVDLAAILARYLVDGPPADAVTVHGLAADAALGDGAREAAARDALGLALLRQGRPATATAQFDRAEALFADLGDLAGQARAALGQGLAEGQRHRLEAAAARFERSLHLFEQAGDRTGEARALNNLGLVEERLGRYSPAEAHQQRALVLYEQLGILLGVAAALTDLGIVEHRLGRAEQAAAHHRQALELFLDGRDRLGESWARNGLGEAAMAFGDPSTALTHHAAALAVATIAAARDQEARAHLGLGDAHEAMHDLSSARAHHEEAVALFTELGMPEADGLRTRLTRAPEEGPR
ncbi:ATP-binding protein [Dactylosporangium sp. CA-152071]|uniref:ATP-binding protein n=1 Tax=Dactylosporangium sp. CA-152071 TaxID=3239933 RepID=UPI003D931E27